MTLKLSITDEEQFTIEELLKVLKELQVATCILQSDKPNFGYIIMSIRTLIHKLDVSFNFNFNFNKN